ncbi:MAG: nuclear transport factor 2 family protein [bacterium]
MTVSRPLPALLLPLLFAASLRAQTPAAPLPADLYTTLATQDSALFAAFNNCDVTAFGGFFTEDVEFYHDKLGKSSSRAALVQTLANRCTEVRGGKIPALRRELVSGSVEVHPLIGYGAIQSGRHRFIESSNGKERVSEFAKFTHVWEYKDGAWRVSRELSYDHRPDDRSTDAAVPSVALPAAEQAKYEGTFDIVLPKGTLPLRVFAQNGALFVQAEGPGQKAEPLRYLGADTFAVPFDPAVRLTIVVESGRAIKARLLQGGALMEGARRP